ncbi:hypothetical protein SNE25_19880 [Mucilaginibacter sabulilitoris]|uniref:MFS transporter n=1 Tax=Mucilaginibacter sabulilitoris TaxID=1173583 RepID=A0ABZ0TIN7_9SPHI|nr:hypothetical protein [Mucilaginibacter sabulilitoris]WPU91579.1 hypothetical protein SNE25_19880 [Mucilaginibacter sabulilitoris]
MKTPAYFKPWLAEWNLGGIIILFIILLSGVVQFAAFGLSQTYVISYLGAQPEDITFAIQLTYIAIIVILPVQFRFLRRFEIRDYLTINLFIGILLSIICMYTTNIMLFFIIRFFQGVIICISSGSILVLIPGFLKPEYRQAVGPSVFYGTVLSASILIGIVAANVTLNADFKTIYNYIIIFQVIVLILIRLTLNAKSNIKPYPLYQIDWTGVVFFIAGAIAFAYTVIYGSKYYWFTDIRIKLSTLITIAAAIAYLYREAIVKRPHLDISVFKYKKFWIGLILLAIYYGSKESINIIFGYTASILQWSPLQVTMLGLSNIAGLLIFMVISAIILIHYKNTFMYFLIAGFSMLLLYQLWMYFIFTPDLAFDDLIVPLFFQGAASGLLFVPIMVFTLSSIPVTAGVTGLAVAAFTRFTSLLNAGAGFYNLQLYYNQLYKESFLNHLTNIDEQTTERLNSFRQLFLSKGFSTEQAVTAAYASLAKALGTQGQLLTNRATFMFVAIIIAFVLVLVILAFIYQTYMKWKDVQLRN